jgi:hypothetical protein
VNFPEPPEQPPPESPALFPITALTAANLFSVCFDLQFGQVGVSFAIARETSFSNDSPQLLH